MGWALWQTGGSQRRVPAFGEGRNDDLYPDDLDVPAATFAVAPGLRQRIARRSGRARPRLPRLTR
ncbi:hypothetical protein MXD61_10505 [Frankia sp. AgPm24]|uniref:hypothetical protein n=1 Tax=Frankia sp. AgPm24 TaxID=631128 RepID=UPI00200C2607|nr:hypothetical protein [Frankia sp. AgPm24]MCK9922301.1 hypothetical protein [Frankia sp. AgPm24]